MRGLLAVTLALALPAATLVACGTQKKASIRAELQSAQTNFEHSRGISLTIHLADPAGALRKAMTGGTAGVPSGVADAVLSGDLQFSLSPAAGRTFGQLAAMSQRPFAEQVKAMNMAVAVHADHRVLFELRFVAGTLFARIDYSLLDRVIRAGGGKSLDASVAGAPAALQGLITDIKAGKWLSLPLTPYLDQISTALKGLTPGLPGLGSPSPGADKARQALAHDLFAAVRPFVHVTDANDSSTARVLDVKVQLRPALEAAFAALKSSPAAFPGLSTMSSALLAGLRPGAVEGTITLSNGHLSQIKLDLGSLKNVAPADATLPTLAGSAVTVDINDSAAPVTAPTDLSSVDLANLVGRVLQGFFTKVGSHGTPSTAQLLPSSSGATP